MIFFYIITNVVFTSSLIKNPCKLVTILWIIIADLPETEFIFRTAIFQGKLPTLIKINSCKRIFRAISVSGAMIMILMLNFSARFIFLNTQKENKQKSGHIVPTLLNINNDRITKYYLVKVSFKFIKFIKYFHYFLHSL